MSFLEIVRTTLVLLHIVGFALLFGGWAHAAITRSHQIDVITRSGLGVMIVTGVLLAIPFPEGIELNYVKLAVKLIVALLIGAMFGLFVTREKAGRPTVFAFWSIGVLALTNACIALFWV